MFFKLVTNGRSNKIFLLTSKFCTKEVVSSCPEAIYRSVQEKSSFLLFAAEHLLREENNSRRKLKIIYFAEGLIREIS